MADPVLERRTRRRFSAADKERLLAEFDGPARGEKSAWLRRNGVYAAQLSNWRKTLAESGRQGLAPQSAGRKPADARDRGIERLRREKARLEKRLDTAEGVIELQKKLSALLDGAHNEHSQ